MGVNGSVIDKLLEMQHPKELIESCINDKSSYDGNRKQFADDCKVDYSALCRSLGVIDNVFEHLRLHVFSDEQISRIRIYIETLERLIK